LYGHETLQQQGQGLPVVHPASVEDEPGTTGMPRSSHRTLLPHAGKVGTLLTAVAL